MSGLLKQFGIRLLIMIVVLFLLITGAYVVLLYGLIPAESLVTWQHCMVAGVIVWIIATAVMCVGLFARALHVSKLLSDFPLRVQSAQSDDHVFVNAMWQLRGLEAEQRIMTRMWLGEKLPQGYLENALITLDEKGYASESVKLIRKQVLSTLDLKQRFLEAFKDLSPNGFYYQNDNYGLVQERFIELLHALLMLDGSNAQWWQDVICAATVCVSQHLKDKDCIRKTIDAFLNEYHRRYAEDECIALWKSVQAQYGINQAYRQIES